MPNISVLGAGTAGLSCAIALARLGHQVTVLERHPSLEPVGAGMLIQPSGLRALQGLGVLDEFIDVSVPVNRLEGRSHRGWRLVDVVYPFEPARGVSRPAMTQLLASHAKALGVDIRLGQAIDRIRQDTDHAFVEGKGFSHAADAVVIASGGGSELAVACGLSAPSTPYRWGALNGMFEVSEWSSFDSLQQRFEGPRKMYGLLPTARRGQNLVLSFFWSLPVAQASAWPQTDLDTFKRELLDLWPESEPVVERMTSHQSLTFATYRHAWPKRLAAGRVCLVGDAAHAMSPQLGLGSTLAVGDALSLAKCVSEHGIQAGFTAYEAERKSHVKRVQLLSRLLTPCFQSNSPAWWRDLAFAASLYVPGGRSITLKSLAG
jgi:2-polyprenyl-6-methoxyphenol hydroxylase-like FAD-dependent oxidoreductase